MNYTIMYIDMKVMLKLIPNHSSKTNLMFERSVLNETQYKDYYIWNPGYMKGTQHIPINNWVSINNRFIIKVLLLNLSIIPYNS